MSNYELDGHALYRYLDQRRRAKGLSWRGVAAETGCPASLFTKLGQGGLPSANALVTLFMWLGRAGAVRSMIVQKGVSPDGGWGLSDDD